ncbi:MAG: hypothetical protein J2P53_07550, partial [Bradyrhizobiaceae bacterium]|nr:hypothetical protein [Bradyrhizobiaceae bacterium]
DGRPVPILRADVLFRAVAVGPGVHRVRFFFAPLAGAWEEIKHKAGEAMQTRRGPAPGPSP